MLQPCIDGLPPNYGSRLRPTTLDCGSLFPKWSAFAEKTGKISRNVRGKLTTWRQAVPRTCNCNCPVVPPRYQQQRATNMMRASSTYMQQQRPKATATTSRYVDPMSCEGVFVSQPLPRRYRHDTTTMLHSYGMNYEEGERYEELASRGPTPSSYSREIIRSLEELELNRIERRPPPPRTTLHQSYQQLHRQRPYSANLSSSWSNDRPYATLPKRNGRINLEEQFLPRDLQRLSKYPKSLQDLKYLEIEAILDRDPRPASYPQSSSSHQWEDEGGLFVESIGEAGQVERHEPGKVHYEREYRIYGKDTVALIFYKTCYL